METRLLSDTERLDWLRLFRSRNVGPATFQVLLSRLGSIEEAIAQAPSLSRRGGRKRAIDIVAKEEAAAEVEALDRLGGRMIALCEPDYPEPLAAIADPPPVISVLGNPALLSQNAVGIVGARNASAAGRRFCRTIAQELSGAGLVVASGMARGIDTAAHQGAMENGTVAVVAGGVDIVYPAENQSLYDSLIEKGAVVSEQRLGTKPTARHFPPRNRIISGLSLGVLVVEAAPRSGSLITARMALEQGREVFAVPGGPGDPRHQGTNQLIRDGAVLVESANDITGLLAASAVPVKTPVSAPEIVPQPPPETTPKNEEYARGTLLELLGPTPVSVDELLRECQLSPAAGLAALLELELAGRIERHPGNRVSKAS